MSETQFLESYTVHLLGGAANEIAILTKKVQNGACVLDCEYREKHIGASGTDFFKALITIRLALEKEGLTPLCYGASLNVYPSSMSTEMSSGLMAYKMEMGKPALSKDIVRIFDQGPDIVPSSVKQQKIFLKDWRASLKTENKGDSND